MMVAHIIEQTSLNDEPMNSRSLLAIVGDEEVCRQLVVDFYALAARDAVLREVYGITPKSTLRCAIEGLTWFMVQLLGGGDAYSGERTFVSLRESHARFKIGIKERDAWMAAMTEAAAKSAINESERSVLLSMLSEASAFLINSPAATKRPQDTASSCPAANKADDAAPNYVTSALAAPWRTHLKVESILEEIKARRFDLALNSLSDPELDRYFLSRPAAYVALLGQIFAFGDSGELFDWVCSAVRRRPELREMRYAGGKTLLHDAAACWNAPAILTLLELGSDPNAIDHAGHSPLYMAANTMPRKGASPDEDNGNNVVKQLAQAGADVNVVDRAKRCTALHMAARRGNVSMARALLDVGADVEARDIAGETPLRRAVNCHQVSVADLLMARGADPDSVGSKGITARKAARSDRMRALLG